VALKRGEMVIVMDDEDRENEGDLIMAAEYATAEKVNYPPSCSMKLTQQYSLDS